MAAEPAMKLRRLSVDMVAKIFLNGRTLPDQAINRKQLAQYCVFIHRGCEPKRNAS
jgi:hypothetical protein